MNPSAEMQKPTLTIFANFRIDSEERLQRMKDSFLSFRTINAEKWVVNIRGQYKAEARNFLAGYLDSRLVMFQLESPEGWFHDSRIMASEIISEYVFFWVEDHICLHFDKIFPTLEEMKNKEIDLLTYSFCHKDQARAYYGNNDIVGGVELDWFEHTALNNPAIQQNMNGGVRLVSCISIMTGTLFRKVLFENKKFIWPKETPFDFEVAPTELQFLPLKRALPKHELFASIDDDNAVPNTCLISRGLYPSRVTGPRMTATSSINSTNVSNAARPRKQIIMLINGYRVGAPVLPTGIAYIAQALEDAGIAYDVGDVNIHSHDKILEWIHVVNPKYVGLGTMTFEVDKNYQLLQTIRDVNPDITIILGGPHAIAAGKDIFLECSAIDIVIQGEGEESLVRLLRGETLHTIPGILTRDPNFHGPQHEPLNIDGISFPKYHKFDLNKYGNTMNLASSRGCVYKCSFCGAPKFLGKKWRAFSTRRMFDEFEYWYHRGYRDFYFSDSLFALDRQRVIDFCTHVIDSGYNDVTFTADGARADHLTREILQKMKKANFTTLILGVESVNDKSLDFFQKGETFRQIDYATSIADSLGFDIIVYLIIGAPVESYEDALKTLQFPLKYKNIVKAVVSKLMPIKGTPYYQFAIEHGLVENPNLCYPEHEVSGFNKRSDSHNSVEEIWAALHSEIDKLTTFITTRNEIKKYLAAQGLHDIGVGKLNALTNRHIASLPNNKEQTGNQIEDTFFSLNQQRDPNLLKKRLLTANIQVIETDLMVDEFVTWLNEFTEIHTHYSSMNDVIIEKCLEHYIAYKFSGLKPGDLYIDIAAAGSNWTDSLLKRGVTAYCLDLQYQQGIHGNKIGANAGDTRLPDNSVDAMSLQCAFETFRGDDDKLFIRETKRILKDGGKVVISPLYLDVRHFILSGKNSDLSHAPLDEGAIRVWREDEYDEDFSRHYSPEALANRIFSNLEGLSAKILYINNLDQFRNRFPGQRIYCDFNLYISKLPEQPLPAEADNSGCIYNEDFYNEQKDASYLSAESIVPILNDVFNPTSVIDIGCGVGGWLHVFQNSGVNNIYGYDLNELSADKYFVDKKHIKTNADISNKTFRIHEKSDLLLCLEVAEHLPAEVADIFITSLAGASPIVIFSAALPGQTGVNHCNEQPPWYWRDKFNKIGYIEIDFIRPQILRNENICWWYRQNITCFVRPDVLTMNSRIATLAKIHGQKDDGHKLTVVNEWVLKHILVGEYSNPFSTSLQNDDPFLSVIVPTRNRAALLNNTLESLSKQTYPRNRFEVIVVDNGSTDTTAEVCQHFKQRIPQLKRISAPHPGLHNGRHAGLKESIGEILVYADDDVEALPTWLKGIAESFIDPDVALVGGKILPKFESQPPEWVASLSRKTDSGWSLGWYSILDFGDTTHEIPHEYVWGCNFSIRKNVLKRVGGFHPDSFPRELIKYRGDGETAVSLAVRDLGYKAVYNPRASVYHLVSQGRLTQEYIYQRAYNQGISDSYSSIRKNRSFSEVRQYKSPSNTIHDVVDRGFVDGFNYHQQLSKSDESLLTWVLKDTYLDGEEQCP